MLDKCFYRPVKTKWTSDCREHFDWTFFQKEINCTLCTRFLSTLPFDKTKMCWSLFYFPGTCTCDVPLSADLYLCVRLLSSWQTFVIFSPDWAGWHLHGRLQLLFYCAFNDDEHSLQCFYIIQRILTWYLQMLQHYSQYHSFLHITWRRNLCCHSLPGSPTQCSAICAYFSHMEQIAYIRSLVGLAQKKILNQIFLKGGRKWEEEKLLARAVLLVSRAYVSVKLRVLAYRHGICPKFYTAGFSG